MRRSSGETLLLVVPGGEGAGGSSPHRTRAGAQTHRARPAGLSGVLFVKEEEEEEEGKKAAQASCLLFTRLLLVFLHIRYTSWCGLFTQASLCLCVGNKSTCSSSCCSVSPSCGLWFQGFCFASSTLLLPSRQNILFPVRQVRPQYCAERRSTVASLPLVMALVCPLPRAELDHGVLAVGHGLRRGV